MLECRRMGNPSPGVAPGELSHDGATRIFGVMRVLSDNRLLVKVFVTFKKLLLSLFDDENHLNMVIIEFFLAMFSAETVVDIEFVLFFRAMSSAEEVLRCSIRRFGILKGATYILSVLC